MTIGEITTGLGKLTPDVWRQLGEAVAAVTEVAPKGRTTRNQNPTQFLAKITGYTLVTAVSGPPGDTTNPKRMYVYDWEEVIFSFSEDQHITLKTFQGKRSSADSVKAINGAEFGQPTDRETSFMGVMPGANEYPPVSVVPAINNSETNAAGSTNTTGTGDGPIVMMSIIECQDAETTNSDGGKDNEGNKAQVAFFYSSLHLDGACASEK